MGRNEGKKVDAAWRIESLAREKLWALEEVLAQRVEQEAESEAQMINCQLLTTNDEYRLKTIDIRSDGQRVTADKVLQWSELKVGMSMQALDIVNIRQTLLRVPTIKSVDIERPMPDQLELRITERIPIACLGPHRILGVDQSGYVFTIAPPRTTMPLILGNIEPVNPGDRLHGRLLNAVEVVNVLTRTPLGGLMQMELIDVREPDYLLLKLTEGPVVSLSWLDMAMSTPESRLVLAAKLRSLARILDDAHAKGRHLTKVDMTLVDGQIPAE